MRHITNHLIADRTGFPSATSATGPGGPVPPGLYFLPENAMTCQFCGRRGPCKITRLAPHAEFRACRWCARDCAKQPELYRVLVRRQVDGKPRWIPFGEQP